jgi:hypothetical protein
VIGDFFFCHLGACLALLFGLFFGKPDIRELGSLAGFDFDRLWSAF